MMDTIAFVDEKNEQNIIEKVFKRQNLSTRSGLQYGLFSKGYIEALRGQF